jgi:hypothetical protein
MNCGNTYHNRRSLGQHLRYCKRRVDTRAAAGEDVVNPIGISREGNTSISAVAAGATAGKNGADASITHDVIDDDSTAGGMDGGGSYHAQSEEDQLLDDTSIAEAVSATPDYSLVKQYQDYIDSGLGQMSINPSFRSDVGLLSLLQKIKAPICAFDVVKEWARVSVVDGVDFLDHRRKKRAAALKDIDKRLNMFGAKPKKIEVVLPGSQETVNVTLYDFKEQVLSLLSDPAVMRDEHLIFPVNEDNEFDPFAEPISPRSLRPDDLLQDVIDGSVYYNAYNVHCTVKGRDVLAAVMFFMDKAHFDVHGRLCFEPTTFTLSIFKKELRTLPMFWRTIGYIVNQANITTVSSTLKSVDYHYMISLIFASVVEVQNGPGIAWTLHYKDVQYEVVFKFPVLFIVGDTEGHDKLCGKFLSRTKKIARLCRYCDCPTDSTDDTTNTWPFTLGPTIAEMVANGETENLRSMSYHCIKNGFDGVVFCDPERGINGATLAEILHVWQHGLFTRALAALFGQKRSLKTASRRIKKKPRAATKTNKKRSAGAGLKSSKESSDEETDKDDADDNVEGEDEEANDEANDEADDVANDELDELVEDAEEFYLGSDVADARPSLSKNGVFTEPVKTDFDRRAKLYGRQLAHQSHRVFARSYFLSGITTNAKKNGHEEKCVLLLCLLIFVSDKGRDFDEALDGVPSAASEMQDRRSDAFIQLITNLLLIEVFLKEKQITVRRLRRWKAYIPLFMESYKQVVDRVDGMGMKFIKFHLPLHSPWDIGRFGPAMSWDSSTGESHHKEQKDPASHTQQNTDSFEFQLARRHTENLMINRAKRFLQPPASMLPPVVTDDQRFDHPFALRGYRYYVDYDGMFVQQRPTISLYKQPIPAIWPDDELRKRVQLLIIEFILPHVRSGVVKLYTELKWTDVGSIFRAAPTWGPGKTAWNDWAGVDWDPGGPGNIVPVRLVIFLTVDDFALNNAAPNLEYFPIKGNGTYAVVQSLIESISAIPTHDLNKTTHGLYKEDIADGYIAHPSCPIVHWSCLEMEPYIPPGTHTEKLAPKLHVIPTRIMTDTRIVVPFDLDIEKEHPKYNREWLIVTPPEQWGDIFATEVTRTLRQSRES